jgi:hypothetical protein
LQLDFLLVTVHWAPRERSTAGIVFKIKAKSWKNVLVSAYLASIAAFSSDEILLRPDVCQTPVMPGLTDKIMGALLP